MKKFFTLIAMMFVAGATMYAQDEEWGPNLFENSDLEADGEYPFFYVKSNFENPDNAITNATSIAGAGVDNSKGIKVVAKGGATNPWDSQFWIQIPEEISQKVIENAEQIHITFDCRAEWETIAGEEVDEIVIGTQGHSTPGSYLDNNGCGQVSFKKEWTKHEGTLTPSASVFSIAFNLCEGHLADDVTFYIDNITIQATKQNEEIVKYWAKLIQNGDFEQEATSSFTVRIHNAGDGAPTIEEGIGVDDSRGIKVVVPAKESQTWDSQFFINFKEKIQEGQMVRIKMSVKSNEAGNSIESQCHQEAGNYIYWNCVGNVSFTEEWTTFEKTITVSKNQAVGENSDKNGFGCIAFNLATADHEVTYYFDNIDVRVMKEGSAGDIPEIIELRETIENAENTYYNDAPANSAIREAFKTAFEEAQSICDNLDQDNAESAMYTLASAKSKFESSIKDYQSLKSYIEWVQVKMKAAEAMGERYADLKDALDELQGGLQDEYAAEELVKEDITDKTHKTPVKDMISKFIAENVQDGDDITILMENPDFAGSTTGWQRNGGSKALDYGPSNRNTLDMEDGKNGFLPTGMAEVWHGSFDAYQTLTGLPAGLYTLTVNACQRGDDDSDETALFYGIVNDQETHKLLMSVYDDPAPEMLFDTDGIMANGAENSGKWPSIENPNGEGWIPNGKGSANYHLNAGFYLNTLNVLMSEGGDLTFGIKDTNTTGWAVMDNFKIVYHTLDNKLALAAAIEGLIEVAQGLTDLTDPADEAMYKSVKTAKDVVEAIDATSTEDAKSAFDALAAAIDDARANIKIQADYENEFWDFCGIYDEFKDNAIPAVAKRADEANAKYDIVKTFTTEEIKALIDEMKYLAEALLVPAEAAEATDDVPFDMTDAVLVTKGVDVDFEDFESVGANKDYPGWSGSKFGTGGGTAGPVGERWNQSNGFNTYVDLKGLPEGMYSLSCDGAYRIGGSVGSADWDVVYNEGTTDQYAYLYAEAAGVKEFAILPNIAEGKLTEEECADNGIDNTANCDSYNASIPTGEVDSLGNDITTTVKYYFPNQLYTADQWMQAGFFKNTVVNFKVGADGNARIGIRREKGQGNNWCFVDNFKLTYYGADSKILPTDIEGIAIVPAAKGIYTISGVRVNSMNKAGLYIVNGKKVLVK